MGVPLSGALLSKQGMSWAALGGEEALVPISGLRLRSRGAYGWGERSVEQQT